MAEESNSQNDDSGGFELNEENIIDLLVKFLMAGPADRRTDGQEHEVNDLDNVDELAAVFPEGAAPDQHQGVSMYLITESGETPTEEQARGLVMNWLKERNPAFGNASPRTFLHGDESQKRYLASFLASIELDSFS